MFAYCENNGRIDIFNQLYFEKDFLPRRKKDNTPLWEVFPHAGELCYLIKMDDPQGVCIWLRSSIDWQTLQSDASGENSFRLWLVLENDPGTPISPSYMVTRKAGWQDRLKNKFTDLRNLRKKAGNCSACGHPRSINKVKKQGENKGRLFASHCRKPGEFVWLT